jgi:hypothetical protein
VSRGRAFAVIMACVLVAGCGSQNAGGWFKERFAPMPLSARVAQVESPKADERREALQALAADKRAIAEPSIAKLFCIVALSARQYDEARARPDEDPMVRATAVAGLANMQGDGVLDTLGKVALNDKNVYVRREAVLALASRVPAEGAAVMIEALKNDSSPDVRLAAAEGLRHFRDKAALQALIEVVEDANIAIATKAWESLRYMTGQALPREALPWGEFMTSADDPFMYYGKPPPLPRGPNQRPHFTKGPREFIWNLFKKDVRDAELR